jgi:predicted transcriptional regulator YheO
MRLRHTNGKRPVAVEGSLGGGFSFCLKKDKQSTRRSCVIRHTKKLAVHTKEAINFPIFSPAVQKENQLLLREGQKIAQALGRMFAPFCEAVLHDLTRVDHSVVAIECPLSGRQVGDAITQMGLQRVKDPSFPDIVQNYANAFPDGRAVKSTSIGLRNSKGKFIAAICLNFDISLFSSMQQVLNQFVAVDSDTAPVHETLRAQSSKDIREAIEMLAAQRNVQPRALSAAQRREVICELDGAGLLLLRGAVPIAAKMLGISRASVYHALKEKGMGGAEMIAVP